MNEQEFKNKINERWGDRHNKGRRWVGVFLVIVGGLLLARATGVLFPVWFFTWPVFLIGFGLFSGVRHNFRGVGWLIPIVIGGIFLADSFAPELRLKPYLWPLAIVAMGLLFIFRPKKSFGPNDDDNNFGNRPPTRPTIQQEDVPHLKTEWQTAMNDGNDVIDATAIFGGVKKNVLSKNFRGGDVTTFMGGAEINLSQADCNGRIMIDCFNMFGGTKLIVPSDWDVQSGLVSIFGGIEDKRQPAQVNPSKVLFLDGTNIFGGVEIRSF